MSTISIRLPESLHHAARELAEREKVSLNQLVTLALAEKISALAAEDFLEERARRGSSERFRSALAKVPDAEPDERDRL